MNHCRHCVHARSMFNAKHLWCERNEDWAERPCGQWMRATGSDDEL